MKLVRTILALGLLVLSSACRSTGEMEDTATYCDSIDSCTGCALNEKGVCDDKGTLACSGDAVRCSSECIHTSGAAQCGHPGCACGVSCGCR
jgi:hypothetical protein